MINLSPFLKHFLHWASRTSLAISTLPTSLAAPSLISSQVSSPTLTLSPGPLLSTHYLDNLTQSHGFNAGNLQSPVSNQTSSLPPDSFIQLPTQHLHLDIYEAFLIYQMVPFFLKPASPEIHQFSDRTTRCHP